MKLKLSAVAVLTTAAFASLAPLAHAQDVQTRFPDGYTVLSNTVNTAPAIPTAAKAAKPAKPSTVEYTQPDGYRPVSGSVGAPHLVAAFPQGLAAEAPTLGVENASVGSNSVADIVRLFPQPSSLAN